MRTSCSVMLQTNKSLALIDEVIRTYILGVLHAPICIGRLKYRGVLKGICQGMKQWGHIENNLQIALHTEGKSTGIVRLKRKRVNIICIIRCCIN
jgi:hypothetical protein